MERRKFLRFDTDIHVGISVPDSISTGRINGMISDVSQVGARVISPYPFRVGQNLQLEIEMIGLPLILDGRVVLCREIQNAKVRFEGTTYSVHLEWPELDSEAWKKILALK